MATLQQIREAVSRKSKDPDNQARSAAVVDAEINRSIQYYQNDRFWFNEVSTDITLVADQPTVPSLPSDFTSELQVSGLTLIDNQVRIVLNKILPDEYSIRNDESSGRPYYYTYRNGDLYMLPYPDRVYTLRLRYLQSYDDLVNDADTNGFTNNASDLIITHTLKNIYGEDKEDAERASYYNSIAKMEYDKLKLRTQKLEASGLIYGETILNH